MKDRDKLWLEYRVNIGNMDESDISMFLNQLSHHLKADDSVMQFFVPVRNEETTIRLIYDPKGKHNKHQLNIAKKYMKREIKELEEKHGI